MFSNDFQCIVSAQIHTRQKNLLFSAIFLYFLCPKIITQCKKSRKRKISSCKLDPKKVVWVCRDIGFGGVGLTLGRLSRAKVLSDLYLQRFPMFSSPLLIDYLFSITCPLKFHF